MSVGFRAMRDGEAEAVAALLRMLPRAYDCDATVKVTGDSLRKSRDVITVTVADDSGLIVGACLWMMTYSSWRGAKGIYVCDLFVMEHVRGKAIGHHLLRAAAREGAKRGAEFIKLEVSAPNVKGRSFYERLDFNAQPEEGLMFLDLQKFRTFIEGVPS
jgi:ribosomal protein S18 acetylase RimI-like enzyme